MKFTAPKIISPRFRRLPLQSVNKSETEGLCDSPTGNFRPFHTPGKDSSSQVNAADLTRRNGAQVSALKFLKIYSSHHVYLILIVCNRRHLG